MEHPRFGSLIAHVALLPDPRIDRTTRHLVLDSVVMAVCAVLGGADTWGDLAESGRATAEGLQRVLPRPQGSPSPATVARVCARLNPAAFRPCCLAWLAGVRERTGGPVGGQGLAGDGKTARQSVARALGRSPVHRVRAWATDTGLVLGQVAVEEKRHASTALPALLPLLELAGCLVTLAAMGTQQAMAPTLGEPEADDLLALQGHPGTWYAEVEWCCPWADAPQYRGLAPSTQATQTTGHGRVERRRTPVTDALEWRQGRKEGVGVRTIVMVDAWRPQGREPSCARRYDSSRLGPDAKQSGASVRGHWTIETSLHWVLASAWREDDRRSRQGNAPEHCARLRQIAVHLLTHERTHQHGVQAQRNRAGWDHDDLLTVLGI